MYGSWRAKASISQRRPLEDDHAAVGRIADGAGEGDLAAFPGGADRLQVRLAERARAAPADVLDVVVEEDVRFHVRYARNVADIEKRGNYTPRRVREQRAYRLVVAGSVAGVIGVVGIVLAVVGVIGAATADHRADRGRPVRAGASPARSAAANPTCLHRGRHRVLAHDDRVGNPDDLVHRQLRPRGVVSDGLRTAGLVDADSA